MKTRKLHMIGNAHIDPVWLWRWQEGFHEVKASFRSALDRMREYPDFTFVASSVAFYKWVEQSDRAMFTEIKQRVEDGRWGIVGGWWVEPNCNIPAGESFVTVCMGGATSKRNLVTLPEPDSTWIVSATLERCRKFSRRVALTIMSFCVRCRMRKARHPVCSGGSLMMAHACSRSESRSSIFLGEKMWRSMPSAVPMR